MINSSQLINPDSSSQPINLDSLTSVNFLELDGRTFAPAQQVPIPEWPRITVEVQQRTLTLKDNDLFLVTDPLGNVPGYLDLVTDPLGNVPGYLEQTHNTSLGLFCQDTRFLSRLELQFEGLPLVLLSSTATRGYALSALCSNPYVNNIPVESIGIERELVLQGALFEEITLTNYGTEAVEFELSLSFDADFVDLFAIRGIVDCQMGTLMRPIEPLPIESPEERELSESTEPLIFSAASGAIKELVLAYQGLDGQLMESRIEFYRIQPTEFKGYTAIWKIRLNSHESQVLGYRVQPILNSEPLSSVTIPANLSQAIATETMEVQQWFECSTSIHSDNRSLNEIIERAGHDIALLMQTFGEGQILSAGIPWYSTLFGRDSLIVAMQTLILNPDIARETLEILAEYQGKETNDWRDEEPGKMLHELRRGEMARCGKIPHTPYYGSVDSTPLWLMLYADYYAWIGDRSWMDRYWDCALAAMEWIDGHSQDTGYLGYECKSSIGLINQGWKDSSDCIVNAKGELAYGEITLAEVQAYVYAAKMRMSQLAQLRKEYELSDRWQQEAQVLKENFERDFWMPKQGYFALALDGEGNQVDSITSNPAHGLGLGFFSEAKAKSVAERLQAPDLFNGWGIRTLSSASPAYNPMGYHIGSVWPHDTAIIAAGLRSLDFTEQSLELAKGLLDMMAVQPYHRPPELFCGFERTPDTNPVRYPVACSPQAWATGTVFQLLQVMVNLVPDAPNNCLRIINPTLPASVNYLSLTNLKIGKTLLDLEFEHANGATACRVVRKRGNLRVVIEA